MRNTDAKKPDTDPDKATTTSATDRAEIELVALRERANLLAMQTPPATAVVPNSASTDTAARTPEASAATAEESYSFLSASRRAAQLMTTRTREALSVVLGSGSEQVNMNYWYKEEDIDHLIKKYLRKRGLSLTKAQHGMILTADHKPHLCTHGGTTYSLSIAERYSANHTEASFGVFMDSLHDVMREALDWNKNLIKDGVIPIEDQDKVLKNHSVICAFALSHLHWMTLLINFEFEQLGSEFVPSKKVTIALLDSMNQFSLNETVQASIAHVFKLVLPAGVELPFEFDVQEPFVRKQTDGSCCGVVTTDTILRIIFSKKIPILTADTPIEERLYTREVLYTLRLNHFKDDPAFQEKQMARGASEADRIRQGDYVPPEKNLNGTDDIIMAFYRCLQKAEESGDKIFETMEEFSKAYDFNEKLSRLGHSVDPNDPELTYYKEKYRAQFDATKTAFEQAMGKDFVVVAHEIVSVCLSEAVRENLAILKAWCLAHAEDLQDDPVDANKKVWSAIFKTGSEAAEPEWTNDGLDKFAHVIKELVSCKRNKTEPVRREKDRRMLPSFDSYRESALGLQYHTYIEQLGIACYFKGKLNDKKHPLEGNMNCLIGDSFNGYYVQFSGRITQGIPYGSCIFVLFKISALPDKQKIYVSARITDGRLVILTHTGVLDEDFLAGFNEYLVKNATNFKFAFPVPPAAANGFEIKDEYLVPRTADPDLRDYAEYVDVAREVDMIGTDAVDPKPRTEATAQGLVFRFVPITEDGSILTGYISCVIGKELFFNRYVCYEGNIVNGNLEGKGVISLYVKGAGVTETLEGEFFTTSTGEINIIGSKTNITSDKLLRQLMTFIEGNVKARNLGDKLFEPPKPITSSVVPPHEDLAMCDTGFATEPSVAESSETTPLDRCLKF